MLEAFMTAAAIALGAGVGMLLMQMIGPGGVFCDSDIRHCGKLYCDHRICRPA